DGGGDGATGSEVGGGRLEGRVLTVDRERSSALQGDDSGDAPMIERAATDRRVASISVGQIVDVTGHEAVPAIGVGAGAVVDFVDHVAGEQRDIAHVAARVVVDRVCVGVAQQHLQAARQPFF